MRSPSGLNRNAPDSFNELNRKPKSKCRYPAPGKPAQTQKNLLKDIVRRNVPVTEYDEGVD